MVPLTTDKVPQLYHGVYAILNQSLNVINNRRENCTRLVTQKKNLQSMDINRDQLQRKSSLNRKKINIPLKMCIKEAENKDHVKYIGWLVQRRIFSRILTHQDQILALVYPLIH